VIKGLCRKSVAHRCKALRLLSSFTSAVRTMIGR
jgi:hypothetical protein